MVSKMLISKSTPHPENIIKIKFKMINKMKMFSNAKLTFLSENTKRRQDDCQNNLANITAGEGHSASRQTDNNVSVRLFQTFHTNSIAYLAASGKRWIGGCGG